MKLAIERDILAVALSRVVPVVQRNSTIPILTTAKLDASGLNLIVTGSNMAHGVIQTCSATVEEPGSACIDATKLNALVATLPRGSQVEISGDKKLTVRYGRGRAEFAAMDPRDFPAMRAPDTTQVEIPASELVRVIDLTEHAVSSDDKRPYLCGICLNPGEGFVHACATDGVRLMLARMPHAIEMPQIIIPTEGASLLRRVLAGAAGDARISLDASLMRVEIGSCVVTTKLVDGTFPDYTRVIPVPIDNPIVVDTGALKEVCQRAQAITEAVDQTKSAPRAIFLTAADNLLHVAAGETGSQRIEEDIEIEYDGEKREIALATAYVLDALNAMGAEGLVELHLTDRGSPCLLRRVGNTVEGATIMPMRWTA